MAEITLQVTVDEDAVRDFIDIGKIPCCDLLPGQTNKYELAMFWLAYMVKKAYVIQVLHEEW